VLGAVTKEHLGPTGIKILSIEEIPHFMLQQLMGCVYSSMAYKEKRDMKKIGAIILVKQRYTEQLKLAELEQWRSS
jgi:hypothetical protein